MMSKHLLGVWVLLDPGVRGEARVAIPFIPVLQEGSKQAVMSADGDISSCYSLCGSDADADAEVRACAGARPHQPPRPAAWPTHGMLAHARARACTSVRT